jgi:nucleoid DNA-binding protein
MNNKEFISELSSRTGYSADDSQKIVRQMIERMSQAFNEGDSVFMASFGTFEVKKRLERVIVNPTTMQRMMVPPKLVLNFKPVQSIKEKLKKGGAE